MSVEAARRVYDEGRIHSIQCRPVGATLYQQLGPAAQSDMPKLVKSGLITARTSMYTMAHAKQPVSRLRGLRWYRRLLIAISTLLWP